MKHNSALLESHHLDESLLEYLQSRIGPIPEAYLSFLRVSNGGLPDPELVFYRQGENDGPCLSKFTSIDCSKGRESIDLMIEYWQLNFTQNVISIAEDGGGNYFMLSLAEKSYGHILYWDHEMNDGDDPGAHMEWLADDFSDFLRGLEECPDNSQDEQVQLYQPPEVSKKPWWRIW